MTAPDLDAARREGARLVAQADEMGRWLGDFESELTDAVRSLLAATQTAAEIERLALVHAESCPYFGNGFAPAKATAPAPLGVGEKCGDCVHYERCRWLLNFQPDSTRCDWNPSRFVRAAEKEEKESRG